MTIYRLRPTYFKVDYENFPTVSREYPARRTLVAAVSSNGVILIRAGIADALGNRCSINKIISGLDEVR